MLAVSRLLWIETFENKCSVVDIKDNTFDYFGHQRGGDWPVVGELVFWVSWEVGR